MGISVAIPRPRAYYTEPSWIDVGDVRVAYRRKGDGPPVLFLHGHSFTRTWPPFHERLSRRTDVIAPEHPGYGETEMPEWLDGFDDLALHYAELLDVLGLRRVHVVGHSLGGWIAAELAAFYPDRLASLTLIAPLGLRVPGRPWRHFGSMPAEELWSGMFDDPARLEPFKPDIRDLDELVHIYGENTTLARLAWNPQYDLKLERRLRRVTAPALVLRAGEDRLVPVEIAERYAELLPAARLDTVHGTGHAVPLEAPEATADLVAEFVAACAP